MPQNRIIAAEQIRVILRTNGRLRLEFLGLLSKLLREYEIDVDDELLVKITLADLGELGGHLGPPAIDPPAMPSIDPPPAPGKR